MADLVLGANLNRQTRTFDKLVELYDIATGAITTTASTTGVSFNIRKYQGLAVVLYITACKSSAADETYSTAIQVSDLVGGTYTTIATLAIPRGTLGLAVIPISGETAELLDNDADWVRITQTNGGTSPSITYGAFIARI